MAIDDLDVLGYSSDIVRWDFDVRANSSSPMVQDLSIDPDPLCQSHRPWAVSLLLNQASPTRSSQFRSLSS